MPKKGTTNNPNGRPKGVPNKSTKELRQFIQLFIESNIELLQTEFDKLESTEKFRVLEKLLPYVLPKIQPDKDDVRNSLVPPKIIVTRKSD